MSDSGGAGVRTTSDDDAAVAESLEQLWIAAQEGRADDVRDLLLRLTTSHGLEQELWLAAALRVAAINDHVGAVHALLLHAGVDANGAFSFSPVWQASWHGSADAVRASRPPP